MTGPRVELDSHTFARCLRQAVHDKKHEVDPSSGLRHFWDSSNLSFPVLGYSELPPRYPRVDGAMQLQHLVGALYMAGHLGTVWLLPGHAIEFQRLAKQLSDRRNRQTADDFIRGHPELLGALADVLATPSGIESASVEELTQLIGRLRDIDPSTFVLVMSLAGDPAWRVQRWLTSDEPLLRFAEAPAVSGNELAERAFGKFWQTLNTYRPGQQQAQSNVLDATVLAGLVVLSNGGPPYPRFYTTTPALSRLYSLARLRENFEYEAHDSRGKAFRDTIWRTPQYYYLRSLFPALRISPPYGEMQTYPVTLADDSPSLDELASLADELLQLVEISPSRFETTVDNYKFSSGGRLKDSVDEFRKVGMAHAWSNLDLPVVASGLFDNLRGQLNSISESARFQNILNRSWPNFEEFTNDLTSLRMSVDNASKIATRLQSMRGIDTAVRGDARLFLEDHVLAQRWGLPLDNEFGKALSDILLNQTAASSLVDLVSLRSLQSDARRLPSLLAILYGLEAYSEIRQLIQVVESTNVPSARTIECQLIQYATQIRTAVETDARWSIGVVVRQVAQMWRTASPADQRRLCLGFGHCFSISYIRTSLSGSGPSREQSDELIADSLRQLMAYIAANLDDIGYDSAGRYAFAVNFLAHNSLYLVPPTLEADLYFIELARLVGSSDRFENQFRFADTIAYRDLRFGIRSAHEDRQGACRRIGSALETFESLRRKTRSRTIRSHFTEAAEASRVFGC